MSQKQINPRAKELVEICQQVLDVELGAIVASRKIQSLAFEL
jgi:metal-sulfur cluster biosynthetic enzyme